MKLIKTDVEHHCNWGTANGTAWVDWRKCLAVVFTCSTPLPKLLQMRVIMGAVDYKSNRATEHAHFYMFIQFRLFIFC